MTSEKGLKRDKNQNIQVFVRLRPLNQRERDIKSLGVVEVVNNREVVVRQSQQTSLTKKFTFDRAFAPHAKQVEVYQDVVSPLIDEVLAGYNCTVFAYGQTGTGKTHTMVGESSGVDTTWQNDPLAGIIPRALSQLFDELRITNTEYTVRVSYLELYNEELFDLLSTSEDNSKLRIYEDVTRKGSNIVNGLEEITVYNKNEVYKIMEQGQERKRVASTLMNAQSSRSHTVFTIVVHMKENSPEGEELVKIGKLNLVDLAGSENISKAGSDVPSKRERARECVNINQSLLTLGRVITALVERHPHIPYRESKLTRILQESLGGRTKTSIIATISPGHKDLEETMSTLEYAHRAKNIQNKPEINQKLTKKAILKEFVEEIDKLKRDLQAARDKNGVYLASDTFTEMTLKQEEQRKEIQELLLKKRAMEEERDRMEAIFKELSAALAATTDDLHCAKHSLQATRAQLADTDQMLSSTRSECSEQKHLVSVLCATERKLGSQAQLLLAAADAAAGHAAGLHDAVDRRRALDKRQADQRAAYRHQAAQLRAHEAAAAALLSHDAAAQLDALTHASDEYTTSTAGVCAQNIQELEELERYMRAAAEEVQSLISSKYEQLSLAAQEQGGEVSRELHAHHRGLQGALAELAGGVCGCLQQARQLDLLAGPAEAVGLWHATAAERVEALRRAHGVYCGARGAGRGARGAAGDSLRDRRRARAQRARGLLRHWLAETEKEKAFIEERTSKLFNGIETHRQETLERINSIEEQLARERQVLHRLGEEITDLEQEKKYLVEKVDARQEWMLAQLKVSEEEMEMADRDHEESEKEMQEGARIADEFDKEFEDGTSALGGQLAALAPSVQSAVEAVRAQLLGQLDLAQACVQEGTSALVESDGQMVKRLADDNEALLTQLMVTTKETLDTIHENVQSTENSARPMLQQLAGSAGSLMAAAQAQLASQREALGRLGALLARAAGGVCEAAHAHAQLEERCLGDQYPLYSPTGKTPQRVQYRYPRRLAATSPLARVLARRRAAREAPAEACVVLEDGPSDAESSTSEDQFAAPSPPAPPPQPQALTKTVSETDIYSIKRQQERNGKENANHSLDRSSNKKPSKLPAPMSNKKPLLERNDNN